MKKELPLDEKVECQQEGALTLIQSFLIYRLEKDRRWNSAAMERLFDQSIRNSNDMRIS
jgi:hypothetical protein